MDETKVRFSLRQLRYFVVTAETLSFTAAAKKLHISQPSISTALSELESSFGVQLFMRHHASGLSLTPAGRDMLGQAQNLLKNAEDLQLAARTMDGGMTGEISLGCMVSLAPLVMPALISRFLGNFSGISFRTLEEHQHDLLHGLRVGTLDLALTYDLNLTEDISFTPIVSLPPYLILPARHRLAHEAAVSLTQLLDEPYVLLDLPYSREYFAQLFDAVGHWPVPAFRSSQPEVVRGMVANGLGFSILNFPLKSTRTVDGAEFVVKPFKEDVTPTTVGIARSSALKPRMVVQRFASFCESEIKLLHSGPGAGDLAHHAL
jgi:DNA-binding transcriptional LysR family regulator